MGHRLQQGGGAFLFFFQGKFVIKKLHRTLKFISDSFKCKLYSSMRLALLFVYCLLVAASGNKSSCSSRPSSGKGVSRPRSGVKYAVTASASAAGEHEVGRKQFPHRHNLLRSILHELGHGKLKFLIITLSTVVVFVEVFEEVAQKIPWLERLVGHKLASVHHGVFLLSFSHLITALSELIQHAEESAEASHHLKADEHIRKLTKESSFSDEKSAALAYDHAAIKVYGRSAATNFPQTIYKNSINLDSKGKLPEKESKFRGVIWNNDLKAWVVPPSAFGHAE